MKVQVPTELMKRARRKGAKSRAFQGERFWGELITIETAHASPDDIALLLDLTSEYMEEIDTSTLGGERRMKEVRGVIRQLQTLLRITSGKARRFKRVEDIAEAIRHRIQQLPNHWVFFTGEENGEYKPYLVTDVSYHPPFRTHGDYVPARCSLSLRALSRGRDESKKLNIRRETLGVKGVDADGALYAIGVVCETSELVAEYEKEAKHYESVRDRTGDQFLAHGTGKLARSDDEDSFWSRLRDDAVTVGGKYEPAKVILDDDEGWGKENTTTMLPDGLTVNNETFDDDETGFQVSAIPQHPMVRVFDLEKHIFVELCSGALREYAFDPAVFNRLVMPHEHKQLIEVLVMSAMEGGDLVAGKGRGTIILTSGPPGTGKTLTAELMSERAGVPLYKVQCSQLGTEPSELETELAVVLERAAYWGAILLIDEADVFLHERGSDIDQNAVVGVFLRLLEYYTGVMFLTTNRGTKVDDAIKSRCIAHVRYQIPDTHDARELWRLYLSQYNLVEKDNGKLNARLGEAFPKLSGRSIKTMCAMAKVVMTAGQDIELNERTFQWIAQFQDIEDENDGDGAGKVLLGKDLKPTMPRKRLSKGVKDNVQ